MGYSDQFLTGLKEVPLLIESKNKYDTFIMKWKKNDLNRFVIIDIFKRPRRRQTLRKYCLVKAFCIKRLKNVHIAIVFRQDFMKKAENKKSN